MLWPTDSEPGAPPLVNEKSEPEIDEFETVTADDPVLVIVTLSDAVLPTETLPKPRVVELAESVP